MPTEQNVPMSHPVNRQQRRHPKPTQRPTPHDERIQAMASRIFGGRK